MLNKQEKYQSGSRNFVNEKGYQIQFISSIPVQEASPVIPNKNAKPTHDTSGPINIKVARDSRREPSSMQKQLRRNSEQSFSCGKEGC